MRVAAMAAILPLAQSPWRNRPRNILSLQSFAARRRRAHKHQFLMRFDPDTMTLGRETHSDEKAFVAVSVSESPEKLLRAPQLPIRELLCRVQVR